MYQDELDLILEQHKKWLSGCGKRADLRRADLRRADLRRADLRGADLRGADLEGAGLTEANLEGADLRGADLRGADLRGADLEGAKYRDIKIENIAQYEIRYKIFFISKYIRIGCKEYTIEEWKDFTDKEIAKMDDGALEWWKRYKEFIFSEYEKYLKEDLK